MAVVLLSACEREWPEAAVEADGNKIVHAVLEYQRANGTLPSDLKALMPLHLDPSALKETKASDWDYGIARGKIFLSYGDPSDSQPILWLEYKGPLEGIDLEKSWFIDTK